MPTFRHGRGAYVLFDAYNLTPYFREANRNSSVDLAETSAFGTFDKTFVVGMREGRLSFSGMFDGSTDAVDSVLATVLGQEAAVPVTFGPEGLAIGRRTYIAQTEETSYEVTASISDVVAVSTEVAATGGIWSGVSLHDIAAGETTTGNGTSVDNGAATTLGAQAALHVVTNTRDAGSIAVKVQHSTDDAIWSDLITFASVGFGVEDAEYLTVAGTINRYLRAQWTVTGGTTGSCTFNVSCARENT